MTDAEALEHIRAPDWALHVGQAGRNFILLAVLLLVASAVCWVLSGKKPGLERYGRFGFASGALSLIGAFGCLAVLFLTDQFEYTYVQSHSDAPIATYFKIAAIWSGQQGSFLLWAVASALFGMIAVPFTGIYRKWFTVPYALFLAALGGILAYETPFALNYIQGIPAKFPQGNGLTPTLQNYWVVIHPPTIFVGFGSLTVMFCWAVSAMLTGNVTDWVKMMRPWAILSLAILGLGLCMGGFWAYETLNWGGFWAWDPVENVSFVPWIFTAALVHGMIVQVTKGRWIWTNLLLAGLPFLMFGYGTFLTRSGFYEKVSVHSFAEMQRTALWILLGLVGASVVGFFALWFTRGRALSKSEGGSEPGGINRESSYRLGVFSLLAIGTATAIGMSVPLITGLAGRQMSVVEKELYHQVLAWFAVPMLVLMAAAPFVSWRSMTWRELSNRFINVVSIAAGLTGAALLVIRHPQWGVGLDASSVVHMPLGIVVPSLYWIGFLIFLTLLAGIANIWRLLEMAKRAAMSVGGFISHIGVAVLLAGMFISMGFERTGQTLVFRDEPGQALGYTIAYKGASTKDLLDRDRKETFDVQGPENFVASPGAYYSPNSGEQAQTWPHIQRHPLHDVYFALHSPALFIWPEPVKILPGQSHSVNDVTVQYKGMRTEGELGQAGTKFIADMHVTGLGADDDVSAALQITNEGMKPGSVDVNKYIRIFLLRIDPADKGAMIQAVYTSPLYPVEIYYKPMTILVWLGAGILAFGGFFSALYRRVRRTKPGGLSSDQWPEADPHPEEIPSTIDAPLTTP